MIQYMWSFTIITSVELIKGLTFLHNWSHDQPLNVPGGVTGPPIVGLGAPFATQLFFGTVNAEFIVVVLRSSLAISSFSLDID